MSRGLERAFLCLALVLTGACSITPPGSTPPGRLCNFQEYRISVPIPSQAKVDRTSADQADPALVARVREALATPNPDGGPGPRSMLFLSGGSQHGSFGAGFLHGWAERNGGELPDFDVVTGISTGAILATWAFISEPQTPVDSYRIVNERQLLRPFVTRGRDGDISPIAYVSALRRGAFADLQPLRDVLLARVSPAVLREVARRSSDEGGSRLLVVGVVDTDSGHAYALDLGAMAERYVAAEAAGDVAARDVAHHCYVDAILASSSVPLAALPVFIDHRMMIDGGARFGMFSEDVLLGVPPLKKRNSPGTRLYVIANGDLESNPSCGPDSAEARPCTVGDPDDPASVRHRNWDLLQLAMRSENIVVNQVYRFSANHIISRRKDNPVFFARIGGDAEHHEATIDNPELVDGGADRRSCRDWWNEDEQRLHPIQFYPRYMHCLIDYGMDRGRRAAWDEQPPADAGAAGASPAPPPKTAT